MLTYWAGGCASDRYCVVCCGERLLEDTGVKERTEGAREKKNDLGGNFKNP